MALLYEVENRSGGAINIIDDADADVDWDNVRWAGSGQFPVQSLDTTIFFETSGSIAMKAAGNSWKSGLAFDWYNDQSSTVQDLTVSGDEMIGMMVLMTTESVALTRAAGGFFMWVSSDTTTGHTAPTEYSEWWVGGSDFGTSGWKQYFLDTRKAPSFTAGSGSTVTITSSSATTNEILTASAHGLFTGQTVTIASHTGSTPSINRADWEIRVTDSTHFVIVDDDGTDLAITVGGTGGTVARDGADLTAIRRFGFGIRNIASVGNVKAENLYCDISFQGFPIYQVTNDATPAADAEWQGFINNSAATGNGLIEQASGSVLCNCGFRFGSASQTEALTFNDTSPFNIVFRQHLYYGGANRNQVRHLVNYEDWFTVEALGGSAAGDETTVSMGVLVGTGDDRQGVNGTRFSTEDIENQTFSIDFGTDIADIVSVNLNGCEFIGARDGVVLDDGNKTTLIGCLFQRSGLLDVGTTNNGAELFDCTFLDPEDRVNFFNDALKWPGTTTNITDCSMITTGVPTVQSMIAHPAAGTFTYDNIKFFGAFNPLDNTLYQLRADFSGTLIDEYEIANTDVFGAFDNGSNEGLGQSFLTGGSATIRGLTLVMKKTGAPTGTIKARIYAHTGTFGTSSVPTGAALAVSEELDVTKLGTGNNFITFPFNDNVVLAAATHYVWTIEGTQTNDASNYLGLGADASSFAHAGNAATWNGTAWSADLTADMVFEINSTQIKINGSGGANPDWAESIGDRLDFSLASATNQVGILTLVSTDLKITIKSPTGNALQGIRVRYEESNGTKITDGETNASGVFTFSIAVNRLPLTDAVIRARKKGFQDFETILTIPTTGFDIPVTLQPSTVENLP